MKQLLMAAVVFSGLAAAGAPAQAADVGVSITVGQPGFYGRIDIGGYPVPEVIYREPVMVERVPAGRPPIYLRVPPGYAKHWDKHCHEYHACGERVYFIKDSWYQHEYVPRYQERHRHDNRKEYREEHGNGHGNDHRDDNGRGPDRRDEGRDH